MAAPRGALDAFFFDVLHVDGDDLIDRPLGERLEVLACARGRAAHPRRRDRVGRRGRGAFLDAALAAGHEGVMVKALDSTYDAGRRGGAWRKVKPVRTLDLVVLAAEWGHGRRRGWLSNLHLGARDPDGDVRDGRQDVQGPHRRAARVADGRSSWRARSAATGSRVHVRPELVVEIALDGVQASTPLPGRRRAALRPGPPLPRRQDRRGRRHDRDGPGAAVATARLSGAAG